MSEYFNKIKESIKTYINTCNYHLTEEEILVGIKNTIEEIYAEMGKIVIVDLNVNPPDLIDLTDPDNVKKFKFKSYLHL